MKRKFIAFVLVVLILFPLVPQEVHGNILTKEIDVLVNDFKLLVEDKSFSHKEVFIYEGEFYVPLEDLARALDIRMNYNERGRILYLNSKGKLDFDDKSLYPISYQRGYEIQAKDRIIADLMKEISDYERGYQSRTNSLYGDMKTLRVGFGDISIFLDNEKISLESKPILYNGDLYLGLISLSPYLYITPYLSSNTVNIDGNGILVGKPGFYNIHALVDFRESLNNRLSLQLAEVEKKKEVLMEMNIPYEEIKSLSDMEWYLNKHLGKIGELSIDIDLSQGSNHLYYVDISLSSRDNRRWRDLSRRDIEAHIWNIYTAIITFHDEEARIEGAIRNPGYSSSSSSERRNYVTFNMILKDIYFKFINSGLDMENKVDPIFIEDLLNQTLYNYNRGSFDFSARISGYDLELIIQSHGRFENWSIEDKLQFIRRINYVLRDYYPNLLVNGRIEFGESESFVFSIKDNIINSLDLVGDLKDYLNNRYSSFSYGGIRIPIKYSLNSIGNMDYKLIVDLGSSKDDSFWSEALEDSLIQYIEGAVKAALSLWDMNILVEIYDSNQLLVYEYGVFQDQVAKVVASPPSGNIKAGDRIVLTTDTEGATIYYTTDGSMPTTSSNRYRSSIILTEDTTLRAFAVKNGMNDSAVSDFNYKLLLAEDLSHGLTSLSINPGVLRPSFNRLELSYSVSVDQDVESIDIVPSSSGGTIRINGDLLPSGSTFKQDLDFGSNRITIEQQDEGKEPMVYVINVDRNVDTDSDIRLGDYSLKTIVVGSFKGSLYSPSVSNFAGYTIELYKRSGGPPIGNASVSSSGDFSISFSQIGPIDQIIGYRYEIKYKDKVVDQGNLNITN